MGNKVTNIFNKRFLLFFFSFAIIAAVIASMLTAQDISLKKKITSKNKVNYGTALELHNREKYLEAYKQFTNIMNSDEDSIIKDYIIYYGAKSALNANMYDEAIDLYTLLMKEYANSPLYPYAEQYKALAEFYRDDYPISNFFNSKKQNWIKEFVGIRALRNTDDTNKAKMVAYELITKLSNSEAIIYYNDVPENFRFAVKKCFELIKSKESEHQIVILNSWNEWGEGAFVEPDLKYGLGKLEILSEEINAFKKEC